MCSETVIYCAIAVTDISYGRQPSITGNEGKRERVPEADNLAWQGDPERGGGREPAEGGRGRETGREMGGGGPRGGAKGKGGKREELIR